MVEALRKMFPKMYKDRNMLPIFYIVLHMIPHWGTHDTRLPKDPHHVRVLAEFRNVLLFFESVIE